MVRLHSLGISDRLQFVFARIYRVLDANIRNARDKKTCLIRVKCLCCFSFKCRTHPFESLLAILIDHTSCSGNS